MRERALLIGLLLASIAAVGAHAAGMDCAPLGHIPGYQPLKDPPERYEYESADFSVAKGDETETVTVAGSYCRQDYTPKEGAEPMSDLEVLMNYQEQLTKLGATILSKDDANTVAKLVQNGQETWMHAESGGGETTVTVVNKHPPKQVLTAPSGKDYPLLGHMPNYVAGTPEKRHFDQLDFDVANGDEAKTVTVQGAKYRVSYSLREGAQPSSDLDILQNYRTALEVLGAQILFTDASNVDARLEKNGSPVWIKISSGGGETDLSVIEEKAFQASIQPPKADALKAALEKDGHIALHIHFDFGKATLRPDAQPILAQVEKLLRDNPALKLSVEGHTDDVGGQDVNLKLSQGRAAAVVGALVKSGIAEDRLRSAGHGADQPIADNATAEGRAKNRRVELVKI
jgi:outer membrane protein OmpA-like peptidoglycan-associated protein